MPAATGTIPEALEEKAEPVKAVASPPTTLGPFVSRAEGETPLASPAVRQRARERGIDLRFVGGSGPAGRITHDDLDAYLANPSPGRNHATGRYADTSQTETKVVGLRRKIAEKMTIAKSRIPHITYIDEVDVTDLEALRRTLNTSAAAERPKLTILPFLMQAMLIAIREMPQMNARFDDEAGIIHQSGGVHFGIATQTSNGLVVPVVRHGEALDIWEMAAEVSRVTSATRESRVGREALSGSTITITSLGALGGLATTPVINHPEVAIVGVNKIRTAPIWDGQQFRPRQVMNLSSSFDHRVIDGWDAALFVQRIKSLLETPALIFVEGK
jgi:2-oxoisovalerate dehydrogenase E2 component (dihydrolipoyl transacylase)